MNNPIPRLNSHKNHPDIVEHKNWRQWMLCNKEYYTDELAQALAQPERLFQVKGLDFLKQGDTTTIIKIIINGKPLVVKRYNLLNTYHRLRRLLRPTRAWRCWRYAHLLLKLDIATPTPVAMIEKRFGPFHGTAYYIYEYVEGITAQAYFLQTEFDERILQRVSAMLQSLANAKLAHGDLKATNILLVQGQPYLIDLDAMCYCTSEKRWQRAKKRDQKRFMANWPVTGQAYKLFSSALKD